MLYVATPLPSVLVTHLFRLRPACSCAPIDSRLPPQDVSKVRFGALTPHAVECLRHIRDFFGVTFKLDADQESRTVLLTCLGLGYTNFAKKVT